MQLDVAQGDVLEVLLVGGGETDAHFTLAEHDVGHACGFVGDGPVVFESSAAASEAECLLEVNAADTFEGGEFGKVGVADVFFEDVCGVCLDAGGTGPELVESAPSVFDAKDVYLLGWVCAQVALVPDHDMYVGWR